MKKLNFAKTFSLLLFFICTYGSIESVDFNNAYNHYSENPIEDFFVCGERCSGTNYTDRLVAANFPALQTTYRFGHKHFLWWCITHPDWETLNDIGYEDDAVTFANSKNCLFIVVIRNPYDWLRSFYLAPHEVHSDLLDKEFSTFIRAEWKSNPLNAPSAILDNFNPWENKPFQNVLKLRKYKIINYLEISKLISNYVIVRYEDVRDYPQEFVDFISKTYNLTKNKSFIPIRNYLGANYHLGKYQQKRYFPFKAEDFEFINSSLDWELEVKLGYKKWELPPYSLFRRNRLIYVN